MTFRLKTEFARIQKSILSAVAVDTNYMVAMLSFLMASVFYTKMYFKYIKYTRIAFQLRNTNYFC